MAVKRRKVLLIYCGGVNLWPKPTPKFLQQLVRDFFQLQMVADVDTFFLWPGQGADINFTVWKKLVKTIASQVKKYDGFIVTHSLDHVLFTAAMISFLLQNLGKPIIFTGQIGRKIYQAMPLKSMLFETNLLNATVLATSNFCETVLFYGPRIIRATRGQWDYSSELDPFSSWQMNKLGNTQFSLSLSKEVRRKTTGKKIFFDFCHNIKILHPYPNFTLPYDLEKYEGVAVKGFLEKPLPENFPKLKIPVLVHSLTELPYKNNIITVSNCTWETAVTKFMWALAQTRDIKKLRKIMQTNYVGELK